MSAKAKLSPAPDVLLWTIEETQRQLGNVHRGTIDRLVRKGKLVRVKIGTRSMIKRDSVLDLIDACRV